ncbi:Rnt1p [Sugiyamaella lignohabitans]|uniref:ribonuclease III n=1 Tax=Sugiyamaella lignohabitans TaxID=796027 RepID=A0A167C891_9ASCO|nr:Rnt1p [Sugiyamaella lignohabitans]ANB11345.1 Rnt1p [Sugiyamaella lignohabitans]
MGKRGLETISGGNSPNDVSSETSENIKLTDLIALDYAMVSIQKHLKTILEVCPGLIDPKAVREASTGTSGQAVEIQNLLGQKRIQLAKKIKLEDCNNKLPRLFYDLVSESSHDSDPASRPNIPDFDIEPYTYKRAKLAKKEKKLKEVEDGNDEAPVSAKKVWPPSLPEIVDKGLENQVFTHKSAVDRSYLSPAEILGVHNERLEFMGDAVLNFVASNLVYEVFPDASEGVLTTMRVMLVKNDTIGEWATMYGLDKKLKTDKGKNEPTNSKVIADTFEAYIAGVYLDPQLGPKVVNQWLSDLFRPSLSRASKDRNAAEPIDKDAKNLLYVQIGSHDMNPEYVPVLERGHGNEREYTVECRINNEVIGVGTGKSIRSAGLLAAMMALKNSPAIEKYSEIRRQSPRTVAPIGGKKNKPQLPDAELSSPDTISDTGLTDEFSDLSASYSEVPGQANSKKAELYAKISSAKWKPIYTTTVSGSEFYSKVVMGSDLMGEGRGSNKKLAEQAAAANALANKSLMKKWTEKKHMG